MRDPSDTRDTGPRVASPLWIHITAFTALGAAAFVLAMVPLTGSMTGLTGVPGIRPLIGHPVFWVVAALVVLGDVWPIVTPGRSHVEAPCASVTTP